MKMYRWSRVVCVLLCLTGTLYPLSNPFKKNDLATRWQAFNDAVTSYATDMMKMLDDYGTKVTTRMKAKDIEKRFNDIKTAFTDMISAIKNDQSKARAMKATIAQDIVRQQLKIDELKLVESLMLRRSAGFYDQLMQSYEANEKKMPASVRVKSQNVYPFLGVTPEKGRAMNLDEINNSLKVARGTMKGDKNERDSLFRQLGWYFQNKYAKQEFDAFLKSKDAVKALELSTDVIALLQDRFLEIPAILDMIGDIQDKIS